MTQDKAELSGVELARAVVKAIGWPTERMTNLLSVLLPDGRRRALDITGPCEPVDSFAPQSSADDALEALKVMNARGWTLNDADQSPHRWQIYLSNYDDAVPLNVLSDGESFAEALSRAIVAARASEESENA